MFLSAFRSERIPGNHNNSRANANTDKTLAASGAGLELLPLSHPGDLRVGERARFRVLLNGQPLANQEVAIVPGGVRQRGVLKDFAATSDAKGL